ncbi:MAG: hypothetical protein FWG54_01750 [Bacteroidetes bacterium]|nr:hypothetical protein [Bacteroidota bacterium]
MGSCARDLSCYRDMIVGYWVEQSFDGQDPVTNLRGVYRFERAAIYPDVSIIRIVDKGDEGSGIDSVQCQYDVYCKTLTIDPALMTREVFEILKFSDSTLRLRTAEREITYKKVSRENVNAERIRGLWQMSSSSDPSLLPLRIRFEAGGHCLFNDKEGTYLIFDTFLMTSGASCWEVNFSKTATEEEKKEDVYTTMNWKSIVEENGRTITKTLTFTLVDEGKP